jgi:hypothetical protein
MCGERVADAASAPISANTQCADVNELIGAYANVLEKAYAQPPVVWIPFASRFIGQLSEVIGIPYPVWLSNFFINYHIRRQLQVLNQFFDLGPLAFPLAQNLSDLATHCEDQKKKISKVNESFPPPRVSKWVVFALLALIIIGIFYLTPWNPNEQALVASVFMSTVTGNAENLAKALTNNSATLHSAGVTIAQYYAREVPYIALASLAVILSVIGCFGVYRWMLNENAGWCSPDKNLTRGDYGISEIASESKTCKGIFALEGEVYERVGRHKPWGFDADLILWIIFVAPIVLYMTTGVPLPVVHFDSIFNALNALAQLSPVLSPFYSIYWLPVILGYVGTLLAAAAIAHALNAAYAREQDVKWRISGLANTSDADERKGLLCNPPEVTARSPGTAVGLTLLVPGLGQVFAGHARRGFTIDVAALLVLAIYNALVATATLSSRVPETVPTLSKLLPFVPLLFYFFYVLFAARDAWQLELRPDNDPQDPKKDHRRYHPGWVFVALLLMNCLAFVVTYAISFAHLA